MQRLSVFFLPLLWCFFTSPLLAASPLIIAERGAGRSLLDHTLPAAALAAAQGVEFIELPVVMTADDQLLVFRDLTLESVTDVVEIFPDRKKDDGSYYVIDLTEREIRQLRHKSDSKEKYPLALTIPTLTEMLSLMRRLETILGRQLGIVLEIRRPWFHRDAGKDISIAVLNTLIEYQYTSPASKLYLQCFDPDELQRLHGQLMPEKKVKLPLIQLIDNNDGQETKQKHFGTWEPYNYDWLFTHLGLRMIASYTSAIGLPANMIADPKGGLLLTEYINDLRRYGLQVLVFPIRNNGPDFPVYAPDFSALLDFYLTKVGVDGVYTDSVAATTTFLRQRSEHQRTSHEKTKVAPTSFPANPSPTQLPQTNDEQVNKKEEAISQ